MRKVITNLHVGDIVIVNGREDGGYFNNRIGEIVCIRKDGNDGEVKEDLKEFILKNFHSSKKLIFNEFYDIAVNFRLDLDIEEHSKYDVSLHRMSTYLPSETGYYFKYSSIIEKYVTFELLSPIFRYDDIIAY